MTNPKAEVKAHGIPASRAEAETLGYKPIKDVDAFLREHHPELAADRIQSRQMLSAMAEVDCSQTENVGKPCRTVIGNDGSPVVLGYCFNGSCYLMGR